MHDVEVMACILKALHTAFHNLGLHSEGQAVANSSLQWIWRMYGQAVRAAAVFQPACACTFIQGPLLSPNHDVLVLVRVMRRR